MVTMVTNTWFYKTIVQKIGNHNDWCEIAKHTLAIIYLTFEKKETFSKKLYQSFTSTKKVHTF